MTLPPLKYVRYKTTNEGLIVEPPSPRCTLSTMNEPQGRRRFNEFGILGREKIFTRKSVPYCPSMTSNFPGYRYLCNPVPSDLYTRSIQNFLYRLFGQPDTFCCFDINSHAQGRMIVYFEQKKVTKHVLLRLF